MKIWMIWVSEGEATWLAGAWDEETRNEMTTAWDEELARVVADQGVECVRVLTTTVSMHDVELAFKAPEITNFGIAKETTE